MTDYQWKLIELLIPPESSTCGRARRNPHSIIWVLRTGSPWRALPQEYGSWHTAYNNFRKWSKEGIITKIFENFLPDYQQATQIQIDFTYVKAPKHSSGAKKREIANKV